MFPLRQSSTATIIVGPFLSPTDGSTPVTGLSAPGTSKATLSKNGTPATYTVASWTEFGNGLYTLLLSTTDAGTAGRLRIDFNDGANYVPVFQEYNVLSQTAFDALYSTGKLPATVASGDGVDAAAIKTTLGVAGAGLTGIPAGALTTGERASIAAAVEAAIMNEADGSAVLAAIVAKINATDTSLAGLTLAAIAAAVRDVDNTTPATGSLGAHVNSAASAGDPLSAPVPGSYSAGTAGYLLGHNLDAQASAIKAKTDNLPGSPAAVGSTMNLNLAQAVPVTGNTANTVGDTLNAARAQGFGAWTLNATAKTLTLYGADGTTPVRVFNLDSATAPTTRS